MNLTTPNILWVEIISRVQLNSDYVFEQTRSKKQRKYNCPTTSNNENITEVCAIEIKNEYQILQDQSDAATANTMNQTSSKLIKNQQISIFHFEIDRRRKLHGAIVVLRNSGKPKSIKYTTKQSRNSKKIVNEACPIEQEMYGQEKIETIENTPIIT